MRLLRPSRIALALSLYGGAAGAQANPFLFTVMPTASKTSAYGYYELGLGQDLEGFWDPAEKDGGARVMAGPSIATSSGFASGADRPLPTRNGYVLRSAVGFDW